MDVFHLRSIALLSLLMKDTKAWRPAAIDPNDPGLLDGLGLGWGWPMAGSCRPCRCVHSFVGHFKSRQEREAELGARAMEFTNIYVKNFQVDVDEQGLQELFSQFGGRVSQGSWGSLALLLPSRAGREDGPSLDFLKTCGKGGDHLGGFPNFPLSQVGPSQGRC